MARPLSANYTLDEITALIEGYDLLKVAAERSPTWLVRLIDVGIAIRRLPPKERQAVFLIGLIGFDSRSVGTALGVDFTTAWRRYQRGLEYIVSYLNTGGLTER